MPGGNPLADQSRLNGLNDGDPLIPQAGRGLAAALAAGDFGGPQGHNYLLEFGPHNSVHGAIGGNMGDTATAGNDPVFWLHHANVDRLWDAWLAQGGRSNPVDPSYLDQTYEFADESGATVPVRVGDAIGSVQLGYRYDNTPASPAPVAAAPTTQVVAAPAPPRAVAASAGADVPLEKAESKPIGYKFNRVPLKATPGVVGAPVPVQAGVPQRTVVVVEGVSADKPASGVLFGVYLNAKDEEISGPLEEQFYLGSITLFGRTRVEQRQAGHAHKNPADDTFNEEFDATAVIARLKAAGRWDPANFDVVIVPHSAPQPRAKATAEAETKNSGISYKRIRLVDK